MQQAKGVTGSRVLRERKPILSKQNKKEETFQQPQKTSRNTPTKINTAKNKNNTKSLKNVTGAGDEVGHSSSVQLKALEKCFEECHYLDMDGRVQLGKKIKLDQEKIKNWFANRRAKLKNEGKETQAKLKQKSSKNKTLPETDWWKKYEWPMTIEELLKTHKPERNVSSSENVSSPELYGVTYKNKLAFILNWLDGVFTDCKKFDDILKEQSIESYIVGHHEETKVDDSGDISFINKVKEIL